MCTLVFVGCDSFYFELMIQQNIHQCFFLFNAIISRRKSIALLFANFFLISALRISSSTSSPHQTSCLVVTVIRTGGQSPTSPCLPPTSSRDTAVFNGRASAAPPRSVPARTPPSPGTARCWQHRCSWTPVMSSAWGSATCFSLRIPYLWHKR